MSTQLEFPITFFPRTRHDPARRVPSEVQELINRGAIFIINHSGGKDSQAMASFVMEHVPRAQVRHLHAVLPGVDWDGVVEHIEGTIDGHVLHLCQAPTTLLATVRRRGMFPSPTRRQCTSDLKRGPIERTIRRLAKAEGFRLIVNCMGMRVEESSNRAKLQTLKLSERNSKAGREWYDWLPIHDWLIGAVFKRIKDAGQEPFWTYAAGMSRLSCVFCIMASKADLTTAARLRPDLYREYVMLERETGQVMMMPSKSKGRLTLEQITGIYIDANDPASADCPPAEAAVA